MKIFGDENYTGTKDFVLLIQCKIQLGVLLLFLMKSELHSGSMITFRGDIV